MDMKAVLTIFGLSYFSVGIAALFGFSEQAGLFGAIVNIGVFLNLKIDTQRG